MTDLEFQAWLEEPGVSKMILLETTAFDGVSEVSIYCSTAPYFNGATTYLPLISGGVSLTENMDLTGQPSISFGDLEIANFTSEYDNWLNWVWVNRDVTIKLGSPDFEYSDFRTIFKGVVSGIASRDADHLNIQIRDALEKLNRPISYTTLGSYGTLGASNPNKDLLRPLMFGEPHNVTPLLADPSNLVYMVHDGAIEGFIEVRDNGVPLTERLEGSTEPGYIPNTATGTFRLTTSPAGTITVSAKGADSSVNSSGVLTTTYNNKIGELVKLLVSNYGKYPGQVDRVVNWVDIDNTTFTTFDTNNNYPVGVYLSDKSNLLEVCQGLVASCRGQLYMTRQGKLKVLQINLPSNPTVTITSDEIQHRSFSINRITKVVPGVKIAYGKNHTVQDNLETGISDTHKDWYSQEWWYVTQTDTTIANRYKVSIEPEPTETYLIVTANATTVASQNLELSKVPRRVYSFTCSPKFINIELGTMVNLIYPRFGLDAGVVGQVISVSTDWLTGLVSLEVIV